MRAHLDDADLAAAGRYERRFRHDVMAHVHAFGDQAPAARPFLHLGATSAFVTDNADLIVMRDGLRLLLGRLIAVLSALEGFARRTAGHPLPRLHPLPARPAHHGRQTRDALDAGLRARRRGDRAPARGASLPGLPGHDRHPGLLPRAVRRRSRQGAGARAAGHGQARVPRAVRRHRADLPPQGRQHGARRAERHRAVGRQDGGRPPAPAARGRAARAVRVRADRLQRHGLQAEPDARRAHRRPRTIRHLAPGQRRAHRREPVARAHARRQRQSPPHPARGVPRRRRDPGARDQRRRGPRGAGGRDPAARRRADALHGDRALAHARRRRGRRPPGAPRGDSPAQPRRGRGREPRRERTTCWTASRGIPPSADVPASSLRAELEPASYTGRAARQVGEFLDEYLHPLLERARPLAAEAGGAEVRV